MRISDWSSDVCSSDLDPSGSDRPRQYGNVGSRFNQSCSPQDFVIAKMLWQNGVFDRAKKGRMNPHRQYGGQHERDILQQQADRPNRHDPDLSAFYNADDPRLVHGVGKLARKSGKQDRKSVVSGKSVSVRVDLGGSR